jgi:hypothetical protein
MVVVGSGSWPCWVTHSWDLTHRETSSCLLSTFGPRSCGHIPPLGPLPPARAAAQGLDQSRTVETEAGRQHRCLSDTG